MEPIDQLRALAARHQDQLDLLRTEEAAKNALVMPFIGALSGRTLFEGDSRTLFEGASSVAVGLWTVDR